MTPGLRGWPVSLEGVQQTSGKGQGHWVLELGPLSVGGSGGPRTEVVPGSRAAGLIRFGGREGSGDLKDLSSAGWVYECHSRVNDAAGGKDGSRGYRLVFEGAGREENMRWMISCRRGWF